MAASALTGVLDGLVSSYGIGCVDKFRACVVWHMSRCTFMRADVSSSGRSWLPLLFLARRTTTAAVAAAGPTQTNDNYCITFVCTFLLPFFFLSSSPLVLALLALLALPGRAGGRTGNLCFLRCRPASVGTDLDEPNRTESNRARFGLDGFLCLYEAKSSPASSSSSSPPSYRSESVGELCRILPLLEVIGWRFSRRFFFSS